MDIFKIRNMLNHFQRYWLSLMLKPLTKSRIIKANVASFC